MDVAWQVAFGVAGLGGIAAFVLWSLYRGWLKLPIFQTLSKDQLFRLLRLFLWLVFLFAVLGVGGWVYATHRSSDVAKRTAVSEALALQEQRDKAVTRQLALLIEQASDSTTVLAVERFEREYLTRVDAWRRLLLDGKQAASTEALKDLMRLFSDTTLGLSRKALDELNAIATVFPDPMADPLCRGATCWI